MTEVVEAQVLLGHESVGALRYEAENVVFRFNEDYRSRPNRRVLGQFFEDDLRREHRVRSGVPPWFANLLPEGPLRDLVARAAGVHASRDFFILIHLGEDLPGAVQVVADIGSDYDDEAEDGSVPLPTLADTSEYDLRFSLAGVQLKFSVLRGARGVTVPLHGEHGDYIAKLPDGRHDGVPENEFTMMTWASAAGIEVPEFSLIETKSIRGVPEELLDSDSMAFLIRRFDRRPSGRVHIEDFAQVLNRYPTPDGKYGGANYETLAQIVLAVGGMPDLEEFVRRMVALVAMGNGDAHLKNWSLMYEDGRGARLSPAYDLVSTVTYVRAGETLALNLARSKVFSEVNLGSFRRLARKLDLPSETTLDGTVRETVERLRTTWPELRETAPLRDPVKSSIDARLRDLPLLQL